MTMSKLERLSPAKEEISYPRFAAFYNWLMGRPLIRGDNIFSCSFPR